MTNMRTQAALSGALAITLMVAGCTATAAPAESPAPITLTIGTDDSPGVPAADQIEDFARRVSELSGGAMTIEPRWHAAGDTQDWDQAVAKLVMNGDLDLGLIPSRAWDVLGVTSLQPLNTPFLITTDETLNEVLSGDLATQLMAGLPDAGVEGLAMFSEGFRRPFGYEYPLRGLMDYKGETLRVPTSAVSKAMYEALGATVVDSEPDPTSQVGRESSLLLVRAGAAPTTGNVVFYPKVNVLVANQEVAAGLSDAQRGLLEQAVVATRQHAVETQLTDREAAAQFCAGGGAIENVTPAVHSELVAATRPVVEQIAAMPGNREMIDAIEGIAMKEAPVSIEPCLNDSPTAVGDQSVLDGTYRYELTTEYLRKAGVTDEAWIANNAGVYTWKIADGQWSMTVPGTSPETVYGPLWINGDKVTFKFPSEPPESYTWTADKNGSLTMVAIGSPNGMEAVVQMTSQVWERVG